MGTTLRGGDEVNIAFGYRVAAFGQPMQRPIYAFSRTTEMPVKGGLGSTSKPSALSFR